MSHINKTEPLTEGSGFLTSASLWQVALPKVKTTNNATHLLTNALQSSTALHNIFKGNIGCTSLLIKPCLQKHAPARTRTRTHARLSLSYLLLVFRVKYFPFCFYANLTGRDKIISNQWTVRKEVGSSDSLVGCKNRPRRNRFFGAVEALMLVCHNASCVYLGSEMTVFRDQSIRTHGKNIRANHSAGR